jgi:hypothetical protein
MNAHVHVNTIASRKSPEAVARGIKYKLGKINKTILAG